LAVGVLAAGLGLVLTGATPVAAGPAPAGRPRATTTLISAARSGQAGNARSFTAGISADGRYVAFESDASDLVAGDRNGVSDIFLLDRRTRTLRSVTRSYRGGPADGGSYGPPSLSADGRYVAYSSYATNLVPGDSNGSVDAFLTDLRTGATTRIDVSATGTQPADGGNQPRLSADGRYVAFDSYSSDLIPGVAGEQVYLRDLAAGSTTLVSVARDGSGPGDEGSYSPSISADGRYVAFSSYSDDLVDGDTNGTADAFVRDRVTGRTVRASLSDADRQVAGASMPSSISADGRYVGFTSQDGTLAEGDTNEAPDAFVRDLLAGTTVRVSLSSNGGQGNSSSGDPVLTADGRYVMFSSAASNLVDADTNGHFDVFVRNMRTGRTELVSVGPGGRQGDADSSNAWPSADGRYVLFNSYASNFGARDTNGELDVYVREQVG
jgi:Tol biopolymer transport system component